MLRTIALLAEACILMYAPLSCANGERQGSAKYDAWKFIESVPQFDVKYKTYMDVKACESLSQSEKNATSKYASYNINFALDDGRTTRMTTGVYHAQACLDHLYIFKQDGQLRHNLTLTYTDYKNCAVLVSNDDPTECAVLVKTAATDDVDKKCRKKFKHTCSKNVHEIFKADICSLT